MSSADAADLAGGVLDRAVTATPIGSGGDHRSWWIGEHHVLRWAPEPATSRRLDREVGLRRLLSEHLRASVPQMRAAGDWHGTRWVLDERLAGHSLEGGHLTDRTRTGLIELLDDLARCPPAELTSLGVPTLPLPNLPDLANQAMAAHRALSIDRPLPPPPAAGSATRAGSRTGAHRPVLVHADLKGEHLLIDDTGRVTGVLDWSDAGIGDASLDIEGLVIAVGASQAAQIAAEAGVLTGVVERGVFLARCRSALRLDALLNRGEPSGPELLLRRQHDLAWT